MKSARLKKRELRGSVGLQSAVLILVLSLFALDTMAFHENAPDVVQSKTHPVDVQMAMQSEGQDEGVDPPDQPTERGENSSEGTQATPLEGSQKDDTSAPSIPDPPGEIELITDGQRLRRAANLFEYGDCESVIDGLEDFASTSVQKDTDQLIDAHRMLGVCYYQLDRKKESIAELRKLLYLRPNYEMDPFLTPPPVVELLEQLRVEMQTKLDEINAAQDVSAGQSDEVRVHIIERGHEVRVTPWAVILLPFGISQWANGSSVKAAIFGATQGGFLALNVGSFWAGYLLAPDNTVTSSDQAALHGVLWWVHLGALFFGGLAYGAGVVDAWWNWEEEVEITVREAAKSQESDSQSEL